MALQLAKAWSRLSFALVSVALAAENLEGVQCLFFRHLMQRYSVVECHFAWGQAVASQFADVALDVQQLLFLDIAEVLVLSPAQEGVQN